MTHRTFLATTCLLTLTALSALTFPYSAHAEVSDEDIKQYMNANAGDPNKVAEAMKANGVSVDRIQKVMGYGDAQVNDYVKKSGSDYLERAHSISGAAARTNEVVVQKKPTPAEINRYIKTNLNDPNAIADAMQKYNVGLEQIKQATGYNDAQVNDYINKSGNTYLKNELGELRQLDANPLYNKLPDIMKGGVSGNQPTAILRGEEDIDKLTIWQGMHPNAIAFYKQQLRDQLASGDASVTGIAGLQIRIPAANDPDRTKFENLSATASSTPRLSPEELTGLKAQLQAMQASNAQIQAKLEDCVKSGQDCTAVREEYALARAANGALSSQIVAAETDALMQQETDAKKKFAAAGNASYMTTNDLNACLAVATKTGKSCDSIAELNVTQAKNYATASQEYYEQCVSEKGAENNECIGMRGTADYAKQGVRSAEDKLASIKQVTGDGYTRRTAIATLPKPRSTYEALNTDISQNLTTTDPRRALAEANAQQIAAKVTNEEINAFIRANLEQPDAIAEAMKKYGVDLKRIQEATGYTREQMFDYINKSNNAELKTAAAQWKAPTATDQQVDAYIRANINDPAKIAVAMQAYGVDLDRIQKATGYTHQEIYDYVEKSEDPTLKKRLAAWDAFTPQVSGGTPGTMTPTQLNDFVRANLNDSAKIAKVMKDKKVNLSQIQEATGYTREQMFDYINKSNNAELKTAAAQWKAPTATDQQMDAYIRANIKDPAKIAVAMQAYGIDLDRIQKATGYDKKQMMEYIKKSKNTQLQSAARQWRAAGQSSTVASTLSGSTSIYDKIPADLKVKDDQGNIVALVRKEEDINKLPIWETMKPSAVVFYKNKLSEALNEPGKSSLIGIDGLQIMVMASK